MINNVTSSSSPLVTSLGSLRQHGSIIPPHFHHRAQLLYAAEGHIRVYTAEHIWIIPPHCALWIPAYYEHSVVSYGQVRLISALVEESAAQTLGQSCFLVRMSDLLRELVLRLNQPTPLEPHVNHDCHVLDQALHLLIFHEIQQSHNFPLEIPWPRDPRLIQICTTLVEHPDSQKDLNAWADQIGTSSRTLIRLFKKQTGLNYRHWLQRMHVILALGYLAEQIPISKIAHKLGYQSSSAFTVMFKKQLGQSPKHFRK
ncbi:helix-turn-helix domain-containing protein [Acinetobacter sp. Marseille-Q1618]|uniref:AraC family transcriptional regulator n=1 Tax=Acinetobacter sp. Marseille-Q1618 TaxID=2697502 RepID=UPI00156E0E40|nr:helix-turn-helix transcriptional regulator [Acinetobacter sp. Marseille-Q1618]